MTQIGRIGGPLLEEDLIRNGVDIAFRNTLSTTQLLYIDVNNRRIGVNLNNPSYELEIFGTTRTDTLLINTADFPYLTISDNTITAKIGDIELNAAEAIVMPTVDNGTLFIDSNYIATTQSNANIEIIPNGTGEVDVVSNLNVYGNLFSTGDITLDGTITFGNSNTDAIDFNADVNSDIIPDQPNIYSLGSTTKRWNNVYTNLVNGQTLSTDNLVVGLVDYTLGQGNIIYVAKNGNDTNRGDHILAPVSSIKRALELVDASIGAPTVVYVFPGIYEEVTPLVVPSNVSIIGKDIRNVVIVPATSTLDNDVFHLNGETTIQDLTVKNFYYDNINNTGHAFRFAPGAVISSRSPYVQNVSVITNTELLTPRQITVGPAPTGVSLTSNSVTLPKSSYSQALVDSLVGQTAVIDRYPAAPLFYTVVSIATEPLSPTEWRMTVDTTFNPAGQIKPISFYSTVDPTLIITNDIWDTSGSSVGEKWVAYFKTNLPVNFETTVQPGWMINVAGTLYEVDYVIQDPVNSNQWRIYVTTSLVGGTGIPIFSSPAVSTTLLAGGGAWIDGSEINPASIDASMLFHSCTFITPDADAITMTNGVRVEWLNSFTYFANRGLYAFNGPTGRVGNDGSTVNYGAEVRSIGSANIYGNYGAVADGSDCLMYLIQHNFAYIGLGLDSSNDESLVIQANEVVEVNSGQIHYVTTDHTGSFRVGDNFFVDFKTGSTTIDLSSVTADSLTGLVVTTGVDRTFITGEKIETGNVRLTGNNLLTVLGNINIDAATGEINLNNNANISNNLEIAGNLTFGGNLNLLGNQESDTLKFNVDFDQNLNPSVDSTFALGSPLKRWSNIWLPRTTAGLESTLGDIIFKDNYITTSTSNSDLDLRASGSGNVLFVNETRVANDLEVSGSFISDNGIVISGNLTLIGETVQQGSMSVTGSMLVGGNLTISQAATFEEILIDNNVITTTSSNADLELYASGNGNVLIPNNNVEVLNNLSASLVTTNSNYIVNLQTSVNTANISSIRIQDNFVTSTVLNSSLELKANNTGKIIFENDLDLSQSLSVNGTSSLQQTNLTGSLTQFGNRISTGNLNHYGTLSIAGQLITDRKIQFENISVETNILETTLSNTDLELRANGSGTVLVPNNNVRIFGNLVVSNIVAGNINIDSDVVLNEIVIPPSIIEIDDNFISTRVSNTDLDIRATGDVTIPVNDLVIEQLLTVNRNTDIKNVEIIGEMFHTGNKIQSGNISISGNSSISNLTTDRSIQFENLVIAGNTIGTTVLNSNFDLRASGVGEVILDNTIISQNLETGTLDVSRITIADSLALEELELSTDIQFFDNVITTTNSNSNLELRASGNVFLQDLEITGNTVQTATNAITFSVNDNLIIGSTGSLKLPVGTTLQRNSSTGDIRFNISDNVFEGTATNNVTFGGVYSSNKGTNVLAHPTNNTIGLTINTVLIGTIAATGLTIPRLDVDAILINNNDISATTLNSNLEFRSTGTGQVAIDNLSIIDSTINNNSTALTFNSTGFGYYKIGGTAGLVVPSGTTGERPTSAPPVGDTRWNTTTEVLETWDGSQYVLSVGASAGVSESEYNDLITEYTLIFG